MLENGLEVCSCKKVNCIRHGKCAECLEHHKTNKRYPPYCKRNKDKADKKADKDADKKADKDADKNLL